MNYLPATALAVEMAVLHNYVWHTRWTWRDHGRRGRPGSLWRFQISNGLISLVSNLALMRLLTGWAEIPAVPANILAIACTSLVNFWISERWVFLVSR
jgi:putative flippase GtrA